MASFLIALVNSYYLISMIIFGKSKELLAANLSKCHHILFTTCTHWEIYRNRFTPAHDYGVWNIFEKGSDNYNLVSEC